jgi:histidinol-phosphatase (PHP family)
VLVDYHVHLRDDAGGIAHTVDAAERFCSCAHDRRLDEIGFVEHVYYFAETRDFWSLPYQTERCVYPLDDYVGAIVEAKQRGLPVKLGLEVDWIPPRNEELAEVLAPYPWDFLLGSVHWLDGRAVDANHGVWAEWPPDEVWRRYSDEVGRTARSGFFDVLAHPDRPKRFGPAPPRSFYEEVDAAAAEGDVAVELSSGDLDVAPERRLLQTSAPVTLASDAHEPARLGDRVARTAEALRRSGRDTIAVFDARVRREELLA